MGQQHCITLNLYVELCTTLQKTGVKERALVSALDLRRFEFNHPKN